MICGNCKQCFAYQKYCSGCPTCHRRFKECVPGPSCRSCREYLCPDKPGLEAFVAQRLGGTLELKPAAIPAIDNVEFPEHLPLIATRLFEPFPEELSPWAVIHSAKMSRRVWGDGHIRTEYGLSESTKTILGFYAPDPVLENFWKYRGERYQMIAREFNAAFAPNFSVYEDSPRMEHIVNMRRSNLVVSEMAAQGIIAIPDIGWYNLNDLDRWITFVREAGISLAAFSFQTVGRKNKSYSAAWRSYIAGLRYFHQRIPENVRLVLIGINSPVRMKEVYRILAGRNLSFLDTNSFYTARKGGLLKESGGQKGAQSLGLSRDQAFFESIKVFRKRIELAKQQAAKEDLPADQPFAGWAV